MPSDDVDEAEVVSLSRSIHLLSRRMRKRAALQLTASQMSALTTVERLGEIRLGELTRLEQIGKSTMTRLVANLEDAGYLERRVDPDDARGYLVSLTDHGTVALREAASRQHDYLARQLHALTDADRSVLMAAVPALEALLEVKA